VFKKIGKYIFENTPAETIHVSSKIKIKKVTNLNDFKEFFQVPFLVYNDNKYWVPPFWGEMKRFFTKNELFWTHSEAELFVAYKDDTAVGRIAAVIDHSFSRPSGKKIGFFGFFECIQDFEIASALLEVAQKWLLSKGMEEMHGPINGRVDLGSGFLIEGFDSMPYLIGQYSAKYYVDFAEKFKMKKSIDLVSYNIDLKQDIPSSVKISTKHCEENGVKVRRFNRFRINKEMSWWVEMLMEEFSDHYGYTSVSNEEVVTRFGIRELRWVVDPGLFLVAEVDGKPIGFRWSLPDYNQIFKKLKGKFGLYGALKTFLYKRQVDRGRFIIMGIKKNYRGKGIGTCMNYYTLLEMKKRGYKYAEYGWIAEDNIASRKAGEKIGGKLYKIYRVYEKSLV
jgi:GNAT superfamily N-acetyltransferase